MSNRTTHRTAIVGVILLVVLLAGGMSPVTPATPGDALADTVDTCPPPDCTPGRDVGRDFFEGVIQYLSDVPMSSFAVDALAAWEPYENTSACWNPLATTRYEEGSCCFNSVCVRHYLNQTMGMEATAETLALSYYTHIRAMLRQETFDREGMRGDLSTWGTCSGSGCDSLLNTWQTLWDNRTTDCPITAFNQYDYPNETLDTAKCLGNYTIATGGCTITSLAMMLKYYGVDTNPPDLDDELGSAACPLSSHWADVAEVGGPDNGVSYVGAYDGNFYTLKSKLRTDLEAGKPVVVHYCRPRPTPTPSLASTKADRPAVEYDRHYVLAIEVSGDGEDMSDYTIIDPAGGERKSLANNWTSKGYNVCGIVRYSGTPYCLIDQSPPSTTPSLSGTSGDNGWYRSNVQVTLSASDNSGGSGVKLTQYKVDSGDWQTYSGPFTVSGDGVHAVWCRSQDNAGNWEVEHSITVKIDGTTPSGSLSLDGGATSTPGVLVRVDAPASDTTSGLWRVRFRDAGGAWEDWQPYRSVIHWKLPSVTGQTHGVEVQFKDYAGNESAVYQDTIRLDVYPARPSSAGYRLVKSTWGVAGWDHRSASYRVLGTAGQSSAVEVFTGAGYVLRSGYWEVEYEGHAVYLPLVVRNALPSPE